MPSTHRLQPHTASAPSASTTLLALASLAAFGLPGSLASAQPAQPEPQPPPQAEAPPEPAVERAALSFGHSHAYSRLGSGSALGFVLAVPVKRVDARNFVSLVIPLSREFGARATLGGGFEHNEVRGRSDIDGTLDFAARLFWRDPARGRVAFGYEVDYRRLALGDELTGHGFEIEWNTYFDLAPHDTRPSPGDFDTIVALGYRASSLDQPGRNPNTDDFHLALGLRWYAGERVSLTPEFVWSTTDTNFGVDREFVAGSVTLRLLPGWGGGYLSMATSLAVGEAETEIGSFVRVDQSYFAVAGRFALHFPRAQSLKQLNRRR